MTIPTPPRHAPNPAQPPSERELGRRHGVEQALKIVRTQIDNYDQRSRDELEAITRQIERLL